MRQTLFYIPHEWLGLPVFGYGEQSNGLADAVMSQRRAIGNAPRETTRDDAADIFESAMSYW